MIVSTQQMRDAERDALARGTSEEELMEFAGRGVARRIRELGGLPHGQCVILAGKGHNGGDGLVITRHLQEAGWPVTVVLPFSDTDLAPLTRKQLERLPESISLLRNTSELRVVPSLAVDALLGIGSSGDLRGPAAEAASRLAEFRAAGCRIYAVDLPSGLDSDQGTAGMGTVEADVTITIGYVKKGLVEDRATRWVGRIERVPLPGMVAPELPAAAGFVSTADSLCGWLGRRSYESHKNQCGKLGVVAGSTGFTGAARLAASAGVCGGAGLVSLYAQGNVVQVLACTAIPEVMVKGCRDYRDLLLEHFDALAIGPGLGFRREDEVVELVRDFKGPAVIDADALRSLGKCGPDRCHFAGPRLFTPHPGEMEALGTRSAQTRAEWAAGAAERWGVTILLKGARTVVAAPDGSLAYNSSGGPAMASGGMGDVLTGVCGALLAQGLSPFRAGVLGAWVCGRAADRAVWTGRASEESLRASDIVVHLGEAFSDVHRGLAEVGH